ncbi:hypothetical protein CDG77_16310 [Nostoc sp. 'Peltigera membranacea cyanobiont' 213]|uniref:hypothetical protein n=1 Tax=Nostoc sp. 'Peltigera membranacea cyanobiont' 213 TaxID=2014530 RepID=UPI000B95BEFD|nr:hypothetical protein [Nostoc sp. 'Peltigera membranacea cyanobiont' 213]OYD91043.1 hypothetical protein CDG77_16310 [Nostoc sp. 'Peltigera membranacea cyanobiont' 213]
MNLDVESISHLAPIASIVSAVIALLSFLIVNILLPVIRNFFKKPRLSIDIEKYLLVNKNNDYAEFQIDIILTSSNEKIFLTELFLSYNQFFLNRKIQLDKIMVCSDDDYIKLIWGTNLIEYCNKPSLDTSSLKQFVKKFGRNVKDVEIDRDCRKKLIFIGEMDIYKKSVSKNNTTFNNWYINIKHQSGTIRKQLN